MKGKAKKILPIAIIIGVFAIVIGIIIGVSEAHKPPKDTRIPATFDAYYQSYDRDKATWGEKTLLCEINRPNNIKGYISLNPIELTLPYTGEEYWISFIIKTEIQENFGANDWLIEWGGYSDLEGGNRVNQFQKMQKKGVYDIRVVIRTQSDVLLPFSATLIITIK